MAGTRGQLTPKMVIKQQKLMLKLLQIPFSLEKDDNTTAAIDMSAICC